MRGTRRLDDQVAARLRAAGQRATASRRALVATLAASRQPLSLPEILERTPRLPQSSAYRNLLVLEQAQVVRRLAIGQDFARYELAEDLTEHHHHLICSSCGRVRDMPTDVRVERVMRSVMTEMPADVFTPQSHRIDVIGMCPDCVRQQARGRGARAGSP